MIIWVLSDVCDEPDVALAGPVEMGVEVFVEAPGIPTSPPDVATEVAEVVVVAVDAVVVEPVGSRW